MIVDLRSLDDDGGHLSGEHGIRFEDAFGEEAAVRCSVEIDYRQTGATCYFNVALSGVYDTSCHRCLEPVAVPITGEFQAVIRRKGQHDSGGDEPDGSDYIVITMGENTVDLGRTIHENFVVDVPMLIVCRDGCKGLCPKCGTNLNHETCTCSADADPRWNALRDLGDQQHGE